MPFCGIGMTVRNQLFNHRNHLFDVFRRPRHMRWQQIAKRTHVIQIPLHCFCCDVRNVPSTGCGACVDFVVHIGEITDIGHMISSIDLPQQAEQHIKHDHVTRVPNMGAVVNSRPT